MAGTAKKSTSKQASSKTAASKPATSKTGPSPGNDTPRSNEPQQGNPAPAELPQDHRQGGRQHITTATVADAPVKEWAHYAKQGTTRLAELTAPVLVDTPHGIVQAEKGDYLALDVNGDPYPVERNVFVETYAKPEQDTEDRRPAGGANAAELTLAQAFQLMQERPGDALNVATVRDLCEQRGIDITQLVREAPTL